jgi:hypothetical protein
MAKEMVDRFIQGETGEVNNMAVCRPQSAAVK